jgi:hypothetical protein
MRTGLPLLSAQQPLSQTIGRRPLRTAPPRVQSSRAGEGAGVPVAGGGADPGAVRQTANVILASGGGPTLPQRVVVVGFGRFMVLSSRGGIHLPDRFLKGFARFRLCGLRLPVRHDLRSSMTSVRHSP